MRGAHASVQTRIDARARRDSQRASRQGSALAAAAARPSGPWQHGDVTDDATTPGAAEPHVPARGSGVSGRVIAVVIVVAVVAAAVVGRAWLDIRATRSLPGTPLAIQTDAVPASGAACPTTPIPPARLVVRVGSLALVAAKDGADLAVVWPAGYAARLDQGRGGLYDSTGYLVAREGESIQERFFGPLAGDGAVHVCHVARD
jgi:hypothetical protein